MAEVHVRVPDEYIREVRIALKDIWSSTGQKDPKELTPNQIFGEALAVYRWVLEQTRQGSAVVSTADFATPQEQIRTSSIPAIDPKDWAPEGAQTAPS
jgi:hypothetical protein